MANEIKEIKIGNLPRTGNDALKVELVPMPSGDNPWRTRKEYLDDRHQDTVRFYILLLSFVVSIFAAAISWQQMAEARKERIKTEDAMRTTKAIMQSFVNFKKNKQY